MLLFYLLSMDAYTLVLQEDHLFEWLTFALLLLTGCLSVYLALQIKKRYGYLHWFFAIFSAFNFLAGFEEISWMQRVFDWETKGVFSTYSDQNETNIHNMVQGAFRIRTRLVALLVLAMYGLVLPWLTGIQMVRDFFARHKQLILPPRFLSLGYLFASLLMLDEPTGQEEELGEFFYSSCFLWMMLYNYCLFRHTNHFQP
ncbi:hypothetical protein MKJ04_09200 [Pontibacter sp. E15-1]|uniref:hypothetical protein n=1 Tax=Pontibacter sp. E15-1 TaxID=2919918 RepID=UPI001F4F36D3|nr:hypothetical protein [Pontibacter sp. E15-1]MCJ8165018.1 hypothetical protein [Pontibacter sp. E15-1]